ALVGTPSQIGGVGLADLAADVLHRHAEAFGEVPGGNRQLPSHGHYKHKRGGEYHATNPEVGDALHVALGLEGDLPPLDEPHLGEELTAARLLGAATQEGRWELYERFAELVNDRPPTEPRVLLEPVPAAEPVPLEEVEPVTSIVQRFFTGAMSLGALSPEAH